MSHAPHDAGTPVGPPVCPRHPDRVSYVSCQRCGRPVCAECQRPAAVGVQCVDCVNQAQKAMPSRQGVFGGAVATGRPLVTMVIIAICVLAYAAEWIIPGDWVANKFAYAPALTEAEPWRMMTSAFLHSQSFLLHIVFNMYALWVLGSALEPLLGRARFLALYLVSAFAGSVGVLMLSPTDNFVLGASGAIFGLFGALFVVQRKRGGDVRQIVVLIVINAALGFIVSGIAWQAHLGGLVGGALCALAIAYAPAGPRRNLIQWGGMVVVVLILVALTFYQAPIALHDFYVKYYQG